MRLNIPDFALVVLIGASGSGKSTFAHRHFKATEILSSDFYRGVVSDDENDQGATADAFAVLHYVLEKRLAARRLTVIDATNVRGEDRKALVELARRHHALAVAIVFDLPEALCHERNAGRANRQFGRHVVHNHVRAIRQSLRNLERERFRYVYVLKTLEQVDAAVIERQRLWTDRRDDSGPFDIIGDIHGCATELEDLLRKLGYQIEQAPDDELRCRVVTPPGRRVIFLGDLVDRGPRVPDVLRLVMAMVEAGQALCVLGNHEVKLQRKLGGRDVKLTHGLAETMAQLATEPPAFLERTSKFIDRLISHYLLDKGNLVVAHAGIKEGMQGRSSGAVREFCLYGETTGEVDEYGLPVRYNWAADYRGRAKVVYGHTPVPDADWFNGTICLDTGCVFGGRLTALRYPEMELISVPARETYYQPTRPLVAPVPAGSAQQQHDDMIDLADVQGRRVIETAMMGRLMLREENATAALEAMSRFAIDPHWLIYLPPTMSPSETSQRNGLLEHPEDAFAYFREHGATQVVCEEKHMGSRAVAIVCRDGDAAHKRFGIDNAAGGVIYTRTGRPFFNDEALEAALLGRLRQAAAHAGWWDKFSTDWFCLDAELMPWSAKAQALLQQQYAPVGLAAELGLNAAVEALKAASARGIPLDSLLSRTAARADMAHAYRDAYRRYCWPVAGLEDLRLAPFHLLASENAVHADKTHFWHMQTLGELCDGDPVLQRTTYRAVDLADETAVAEAISWWEVLTDRGGEGMVVKPADFVTRGTRGLLQPALKCRGREYLRIIYGPDYTAPEHLERLRRRGLGRKRSLAQREFALGLTALDRFVRREPLRLVHECVFGILALESEPVDPRL